MEQYGLENIRNVVLLSHSGAGKTSITEAVLFATGSVPGMPIQIGHVKVFGAASSALLSHRQNIFDLVFSWT